MTIPLAVPTHSRINLTPLAPVTLVWGIISQGRGYRHTGWELGCAAMNRLKGRCREGGRDGGVMLSCKIRGRRRLSRSGARSELVSSDHGGARNHGVLAAAPSWCSSAAAVPDGARTWRQYRGQPHLAQY